LRRFYRKVEKVKDDDGWIILLDGKSIKTPARQTLFLPTKALAENIVLEWEEQDPEIDPPTMPLTGYAYSAIDRSPPMKNQLIIQICAYAQSDVLCYRVEKPIDLAERQETEWQPILDWLSASRGINLRVTSGINQVEQESGVLELVKSNVSSFDQFQLTGLHAATIGSGSIVLGLALIDKFIDFERTQELSSLEELYQMEKWGRDIETIRRHDAVRQEIYNAGRFMELVTPEAL
jgi:chaperone required for assembly of F1-ATPase